MFSNLSHYVSLSIVKYSASCYYIKLTCSLRWYQSVLPVQVKRDTEMYMADIVLPSLHVAIHVAKGYHPI